MNECNTTCYFLSIFIFCFSQNRATFSWNCNFNTKSEAQYDLNNSISFKLTSDHFMHFCAAYLIVKLKFEVLSFLLHKWLKFPLNKTSQTAMGQIIYYWRYSKSVYPSPVSGIHTTRFNYIWHNNHKQLWPLRSNRSSIVMRLNWTNWIATSSVYDYNIHKIPPWGMWQQFILNKTLIAC